MGNGKKVFRFWEPGSGHDRNVIDKKGLLNMIEYIHNNPVRRGYVDDPAHWRYSSYRNYQGEEGILPVEIIGL